MPRVLLVGAGAVGGRAARQLAETADVELLVADSDASDAHAVARIVGAEVVALTASDPFPEGVGAVALAVDAGDDVALVGRAIEAGIPVATAGDDHEAIRALLEMDRSGRAAGVSVVAGAGLAPGLADVLARHAASVLEGVDEVHVARYGAAGPASRSAFRQAHRDRAVEWRDGSWQVPRSRGPELVWFPDPVGARECETVAGGIALLVAAFPEVQMATFRLGEPAPRRRVAFRRGDEDWGAIRVEVWGRRGATHEPVIYGAIDRTAFAAGTVLGVTAAALAGALPGLVDAIPGVHGLGAVAQPPALLAELARRGVKAAAFEGVPVG